MMADYQPQSSGLKKRTLRNRSVNKKLYNTTEVESGSLVDSLKEKQEKPSYNDVFRKESLTKIKYENTDEDLANIEPPQINRLPPKPFMNENESVVNKTVRFSRTFKGASSRPSIIDSHIPFEQRRKDRGKKTLVLDLDETLIHSEQTMPRTKGRQTFKIKWQNAMTNDIEVGYTRLRPGVMKFLEAVTEIFEVILFTASMPNYARQITKLLDQNEYKFHLLTRYNCIEKNGRFIKDLSVVNRNLKDVIIVDNFSESYSNNPENGLPIQSWFDDPFDKELDRMLVVLQRLNQVEDVREYIPKIVVRDRISMYQLYKLIGEAPKESIFETFMNMMRKETASLFGFNQEDKETRDSDVDSVAEENNENADENRDKAKRYSIKLPTSSNLYSKKNKLESDLYIISNHSAMVRDRVYTCLPSDRSYDTVGGMSSTMPRRRKPYCVKVPQKDLLNPLLDCDTSQTRLSHQPKHSRTLSSIVTKSMDNPEDCERGSKCVEQGEASMIFDNAHVSDLSSSFEEGGVCEEMSRD